MRGWGADPSFRGRPGPRFTGATGTETGVESGAGVGVGAGAGAARTTLDNVRELLRERSVGLEVSLGASTFEGKSSSESSDTLVRVESLAPKRSSSHIGMLANGGMSFWSFWGVLRVRLISGSLVGRSSWAWVSSSSSASSLSEPQDATHGRSGTDGCSCT